MIENGFVHLPKEAAWLAEYLHELTVFPKGKHDDQVPPDTSFRGQPRTCSTGSSGPGARRGIYQLYEERYQAQQAAASQTPKLPPLSMLLRFSFGGNQAVGTRPHGRGISGAGRRKGVVPSPSSSPAKLPAKKV